MSSQKRKRSSPSPTSTPPQISRSDPIEDRSSTFIAYFSPTLKPKDLQNLPEYSDASHKILAWRRESNQQAITGGKKYVSGHDDDGEKFAGKKVESVLEREQVEGACVVARWYGGVLLGPVRFTHIEGCAKEAVRRWREGEQEERVKKMKVEEEEREKPRLVALLRKRDQSIVVLRKLAVEKEGEVREVEVGVKVEQDATIPDGGDKRGRKVGVERGSWIDYEQMTVDRLKMLEKARDATLAFLLKRIDKAEAGLTALKNEELEPS